MRQKVKGYVYFIKEFYSNTYKITKNLKDRTKIFSVKLPFEWEMVYYIETKNYSQVEKNAHVFFKDKRVNGEWFALEEPDIELIKQSNFIDLIKPKKTADKKIAAEERNDSNLNRDIPEKMIDEIRKNTELVEVIAERLDQHENWFQSRLNDNLNSVDKLTQLNKELTQEIHKVKTILLKNQEGGGKRLFKNLFRNKSIH